MNFYTKLISKVDPLSHLPVFKSIQIQLACQACIDAEKAHECVHLQHLIPRWQDEEKHRRLKTIMSDRPDLINSELGGMAVAGTDQCFKQVRLSVAYTAVVSIILTHYSFQFSLFLRRNGAEICSAPRNASCRPTLEFLVSYCKDRCIDFPSSWSLISYCKDRCIDFPRSWSFYLTSFKIDHLKIASPHAG